jgi:CBS domain-containing protein
MSRVTPNPLACPVDATIQEAARLMAEHDRVELPVIDSDSRPVGVISERDITRRAVAAGKVPITSVRQVMSRLAVPTGGEPNPAVDDDDGACCGMLPGRRGP